MGLNDVSGAFTPWLEDITGSRTTGEYVNGRWVDDTPVTALAFRGVIQNAEPDDLIVFNEGLRTKEAIKIHTTFKLVPQIDDTTVGDTISYEGYDWIVYNVANRKIGNYYKAIAVRQG